MAVWEKALPTVEAHAQRWSLLVLTNLERIDTTDGGKIEG